MTGRPASASTTSTGSPKCSTRPPNAIAHSANHVQPTNSPATTSVVQCTPRATRGGDGDGDRDGAAEQHARAWRCRRRPEEERDACPGRRGRDGVTRWERRAREPGQRGDRGTCPVDDPLDAVGEEELSADRHRDERRDRPTPVAQQLDAGHGERRDDDVRRATELTDRPHDLGGRLGRVFGRPVGERRVGTGEAAACLDHEQRRSGRSDADHDDRRRDTERLGGGRRRLRMMAAGEARDERVLAQETPDGSPLEVRVGRVAARPPPRARRGRNAGNDADDRWWRQRRSRARHLHTSTTDRWSSAGSATCRLDQHRCSPRRQTARPCRARHRRSHRSDGEDLADAG